MSLDKDTKLKVAAYSASVWAYKAFRLLLLVGISYVVLYPILSMLLQSITIPNDVFSSSHVWIPQNPTFTNYTNVMKYFRYGEHAMITLRIVAICTAFQLAICSLTGYGLARYKFKGSGVVFMIVILSIIVPAQIAQIPMYLDYQKFDFFGIGSLIGLFTGEAVTVNLLNTNWVYYLPSAFGMGLSSGLFIFIFRQFFKGLPHDLEEAARVDGCGALQTFVRVMIPNTVPVFVTVALLSTIFYWNDTTIGRMFMSSSEKYPLMLYVETGRATEAAWMRGDSYQKFQFETYVVLLITVAPLVLVYIFCQRFFTECIDRSGIKG